MSITRPINSRSGDWFVVVRGDDFHWDKQIENLEAAKEWAIKKALVEAHGSKYEELYPLEIALSEPWDEIELKDE
jgi:hypothetical protein